MTFEIPKDMEFEEISPRKGRGSVSSFRKTVRCGIYIWQTTNVRLNTVIGEEIASRVGIIPGTFVELKVGISDNIVLATYKKATDPHGAYYLAKANGKREGNADVRIMATLDKHLHEYFRDVGIRLVPCEYLIQEKSIVIRMHDDILHQRSPDDPQQVLGF
tara:strand:+ start:40 stop:522 length:483 start_codon:yes stop_codon:yes gene_type:complete